MDPNLHNPKYRERLPFYVRPLVILGSALLWAAIIIFLAAIFTAEEASSRLVEVSVDVLKAGLICYAALIPMIWLACAGTCASRRLARKISAEATQEQ